MFNSAAATQRRKQNAFVPEEVNLSLSFLAFTQFCSFQVPFHSTEWRAGTCSLVIRARKVTLSLLWSLPMASVSNWNEVVRERAKGLHGYSSQGQKVEKSQSQAQNSVLLV